MNTNYLDDPMEEEVDIVDNIYKINEEYQQELKKEQPDKDKLYKLLNKQLYQGLLLQQYR